MVLIFPTPRSTARASKRVNSSSRKPATRTGSVARAQGVKPARSAKTTVTGLKVQHRDSEALEVLLDVEVADLRHLERIMAALRAPADNLRVERQRG